MLRRPYTEIQTAINYTAAAPTREISKKNCAFFRRIPDYWNLAAHSGPPNHSTSFIRPVIAVRDVAETIYGNSDCYQLHSGSADTRNFKRNCAFFRRIPDYWNLAAHSGPANYFTPFIRPVIASRDIAEAIYGVSDSLQLRRGNMDTRNFKKLRLFLRNLGLLEFGGPQRTGKPFNAPYKTCNC